jgi:hypothetical protein
MLRLEKLLDCNAIICYNVVNKKRGGISMTLRELMDDVRVQGTIKVQTYEDDYPTIYYEGEVDCAVPKRLRKYLDREIIYLFPYNSLYGCGICIELSIEE